MIPAVVFRAMAAILRWNPRGGAPKPRKNPRRILHRE